MLVKIGTMTVMDIIQTFRIHDNYLNIWKNRNTKRIRKFKHFLKKLQAKQI